MSSNETSQQTLALLAKARDECAAQEGNGDLSLEERNSFSTRRKRLAEIIEELGEKYIHEHAKEFVGLKQLSDTNKELDAKVRELDGIKKTADTGQKVLNVLDEVIKIGGALIGLV